MSIFRNIRQAKYSPGFTLTHFLICVLFGVPSGIYIYGPIVKDLAAKKQEQVEESPAGNVRE